MFKPILGENTCFFQLLSTIKVNLVGKIMQSVYLCYFHVKQKKKNFSRSFNLISNSWKNPRWRPRWRPLLMMSQASTSVTSSSKEVKGFPLNLKSFQNTATYQKLRKWVTSTPPPPPLYHGRGMNFACTSEG